MADKKKTFGLIIWVLVLLTGCAKPGISQFITPDPESIHQIDLNPTEDTVVLIYSHGSLAEQYRDVCNPLQRYGLGATPEVIAKLSHRFIHNKRILVYSLCSSLKWRLKLKNTVANIKLEIRTAEIARQVQFFLDAGIPAKQIFLTGHSAGGWASLNYLRNHPDTVNAAIIFAPAFAGHWQNRPKQWQRFYTSQKNNLQSAPQLPVLIFAFENDPYYQLTEISFFKKIPGVTFKALTQTLNRPCKLSGHQAAFSRCFTQFFQRKIEQYIHQRLQD
ncbi:MAG: hypothetical protein GXP14_08125 [Gammaproteobacteria bacterium]|nr:hypothetical protein [Gammaproteobacteria bacterium]